MGIRQFEDILSWQKAKDLTVYIYNLFKDNRDYGFRDQIQRASISIMNNIAEGFERKGYREFSRFLYIAKGSAGEVRSMSHIGMEIGYLTNDEYIYIRQTAEEISRLLSGLIRDIESRQR